MTSAAQRPLLFLDIDGPLIPFGGSQAAPGPTPSPADRANPLLSRLDPATGRRLLALNCDLVWATTWQEEANEVVAPRLGLPRLPVLEWPATSPEPGPHGLHWKTRPLVERADGRPFIWVDDEIGPMDHQWVTAAHRGPSLLYGVDPTRGLRAADFSKLAHWLRDVMPRTGPVGRGRPSP